MLVGTTPENNRCHIAYHDAGNAAYGTHMRSILMTTGELQRYFGGRREELLGDALEMALGFVTLVHLFNSFFPNWPDADTVRACVSGFEKSFYRYAAARRTDWLQETSDRETLPGGAQMLKVTSRSIFATTCRISMR